MPPVPPSRVRIDQCILTHWQSLFSNGLESGLAVLDELGRRVQEHLSDEVEWLSFSEIARLTADHAR